MKVSSYYPTFFAKDIESEIKRYQEDFGFEVMHHPTIDGVDLYVLGAGDGTRITLVHADFPGFSFDEDGFIGMRVNVDDLDEGVAYFEGQGYERVPIVEETESFKLTFMKKSDRDRLLVFYHKK